MGRGDRILESILEAISWRRLPRSMPMSRSCSSWVPLRESLVGHDTCQPSLMGSMPCPGSDRELVVLCMDSSMIGKLHISRSCLLYSGFALQESCFTTQFFL